MGKEKLFNLQEYKGKDTVSVKTPFTGIRVLYKWDPELKKYQLKKDGNRYSASIKLYGRQKEKFFERLEEAKRWRVSGGKEEILQRNYLFSMLLDDYFNHIKGRINPSTYQTYLNNSKHLECLKNLQVEAVTPQVIDHWISRLKNNVFLANQHVTRMSYQKEVSLLRRVFEYYSEYVKDGFVSPVKKRHQFDCIVDQRKFREAKARNKTRFMSPDEIANFLIKLKIMATKDESLFGYYCLGFFQIQTGARVGEAAAIRWEDIDFENGTILISKSVQWGRGKGAKTEIQPYTKTGEPRQGWLTESLKEVLIELQEKTRNKGLVFSLDGFSPYTFRSIQYHFNKAFDEAGLKFRSTHILRHSFSTEFLRLTKDYIALSKILGHSNTKQTEHYAKVTGSMAENSFEKFKSLSASTMARVLTFKDAAG